MRLLAFALALTAQSAAARELPEYLSNFTLDNGMQVLVIEDHRAPVVTHMVWYRVGAADEPPGLSGVAHFLEHLMFKGTDSVAPGEFSKIVRENGGEDNAFTSYDYTAYYQRIAADRLDLVMGMEADRMINLDLSDENVLPERDVVLEERAMRIGRDPGALFSEQRNAQQYLNHPYRVPVIGWNHEIEALDREKALAFYSRFYAPNNAILVVAGDVEPEEVKALAQKHFGPIPPSDAIAPERLRPSEPPQLAERRVILADARVRQPYLVRTYLAPERNPGDQKKAAALDVLAEILGGSGITSFLGERLQLEERVAVNSGAGYRGTSLDPTVFTLYVVPSVGVTLEDAEAALDKALADFLEEPIDPDELERIKRQLRAAQIFARDDQEGMAQSYGAALTSGLTVEDVLDWPDVLLSVTEEDLKAAARDVLRRERSVTGYLTTAEDPA